MDSTTPMTHRLAVYGTLKKGFHAHKKCLGNSKYIGGFANLRGFLLLHMTTNPAAVRVNNSKYDINPNGLDVEVYDVSDEVLDACDLYEGAPHFFVREEVYVPTFGSCSIYVVDRATWLGGAACDVIWNGKWDGPGSKSVKVDFNADPILINGSEYKPSVIVTPNSPLPGITTPWSNTNGYQSTNTYTQFNRDRDRKVVFPTSYKEA